MFLIVTIEISLISSTFNIVDKFQIFLIQPQTCNQEFLFYHIDAFATFLLEDVLFGYIWLFFRVPEDVYLLYSDFGNT